VRTVLVLARGFGGFNSAMVLTACGQAPAGPAGLGRSDREPAQADTSKER
jgi:hypothetical protein